MREAAVRAIIVARTVQASDPLVVVSEMPVCQAQARVDVAVIQERRLVGWEIKTRFDKLVRLENQQAMYSRVFDRMWLAADDKHLSEAIKVVPPWWGLTRIDTTSDQLRLFQVRPSRINRAVDLRDVVSLLWRDEALDELAQLSLADGLWRAPRRDLWDRLASAAPRYVSPTALRRRVRLRLMARSDWRAAARRT